MARDIRRCLAVCPELSRPRLWIGDVEPNGRSGDPRPATKPCSAAASAGRVPARSFLCSAALQPQHLLAVVEISEERLCRALVGDLAAIQHVGAIGEREDQIEVVLDDQDRHLAA
jgi:hypothetical protein